MSFQVDAGFIKQYHSVIEVLLQQMDSRFAGKVREESQESEEQFWDQLGATEADEITERFGDSPQKDVPHARRRVTLRFFDTGDFVDRIDEVKLLIDPKSRYVQAFVMALNRKKDDVVISKFFAAANTGKEGATLVNHATNSPQGNSNVIPVNFDGANTDMTIKKLIRARQVLEEFENEENQTWNIATTAHQRSSLLNSIEVTSRDFNDAQALVNGKISQFLGFDFVKSERLLKTGNNRRIPVWVKDGMLLANGINIETEIAKRGDKRFSWYAYARGGWGSTRMQEGKVLEILCDETA